MAYLTRYGTAWGAIPQTAGQVFWVAPSASYTVEGRSYSASDANDGLSPERALVTVGRGIDLATNNGDVVVLLPGAHTVAASVAMDTAGVTLMGLPNGAGNPMYQKTTLLCSAVDETINVTAADCEIAYITFVATTSQADAQVDFSAAADRLHIHHCSVDFTPATAATTIIGFDAVGAANYVLIEDCFFHVDGAFGACIDVTGLLDAVVRNNTFLISAGTYAAAITCGAACDRVLIDHCTFQITNAAALTAGIDGTGATIASGVLVQHCTFGDRNTVPIDNFDAAECELAENYEAGLGATDGGVLIVAIT